MNYISKFLRLYKKLGFRRAVYRSLVFLSSSKEDTKYIDFKQKHFKGISGDVLEIGVGFGQNFAYYSNVENLTLIEPELIDKEELYKKLETINAKKIALLEKPFEDVELTPSSVDSLVATLVFCSVKNPNLFLDTIYSTLKPGGKFFFLEHIRSEGFLRRTIQKVVNPFWFAISGGCQCTRATDKKLLSDKRFRIVSHDYFKTTDGFPWVKDHVIGVLEKILL